MKFWSQARIVQHTNNIYANCSNASKNRVSSSMWPNVDSVKRHSIFLVTRSPLLIRPLPEKVEAVTHFPEPSTVKGLQEFIGMVNFYRRFLPHAANTMLPLFEALKGKAKKLSWNETMRKAFEDTKKLLADATMLAHPRHDAQLSLASNASDHAVGAVLQQFVNNGWIPLAFFCKKLKSSEQKYSTFDHELLALYLGIRHFRYFLEGLLHSPTTSL